MKAKDINPGIRKTVELINSWGYATCDSGDGETHDHPECDREVGYVVVKLPSRVSGTEAYFAASDLLCRLEYATRQNRDNREFMVNLSYDPACEDHTLIDIHNIHDRMLAVDL